MRKTLLIVSAAVALSVAACSKPTSQSEATPAEKAATPDANPAATAITPEDETKAGTFVDKVIVGNQSEIDAGKAALAKSANADVKKFAKMMVDDHTMAADMLKKAVTASTLALTPVQTPTPDMTKMLDDLNAKSGADFDKAYIDAQVDGHQKMLDLLQHYVQAGDNKALQDFASTMAPKVEMHLMAAKALKDGLK